MPPQTDGDVAVVKPYYAIEEAYTDGYDRFSDADPAGDPHEAAEALDGFKSYATFANQVLPSLRAAAGFGDAGHGTYQEPRKVAAIYPGCEEDVPAEADLVDAHTVFVTLVDAFDAGAIDALLSREKDVENAPSW